MHNGDHKSQNQQINVGFQKCLKSEIILNIILIISLNLFDTVLVLVFFLLSHQVSKDIEPVPESLGRVHLPLEHGQGLESEGQVEERGGGVDGSVVLVQIPVVIQP